MKIADVLKKPRFSEKTYSIIGENKYVFDVNPNADKDDIKKAVETLFNVDVVDVNTIISKGKVKVRGNSRNRTFIRTEKFKKAIVQIKEKQTIKIFDEVYKDNK